MYSFKKMCSLFYKYIGRCCEKFTYLLASRERIPLRIERHQEAKKNSFFTQNLWLLYCIFFSAAHVQSKRNCTAFAVAHAFCLIYFRQMLNDFLLCVDTWRTMTTIITRINEKATNTNNAKSIHFIQMHEMDINTTHLRHIAMVNMCAPNGKYANKRASEMSCVRDSAHPLHRIGMMLMMITR